jgi:lysophospholipase L1-like esterase
VTRGLRPLVLSAAVCAALLLCAELALQLGARIVRDRAGGFRAGAQLRILAVGDSHTYGAYVDESESYPAQLQARLDARAPGRASVVNLGIPGLSTTQLRERLAVHVARYRPDVVIAWCGSNDAWNRVPAAGIPSRLDALLQRSRLYRLWRVWRHDRALERAPEATRSDGRHQDSQVDLRVPGRQSWALRHGGVVETLRNDRAPALADAEMEQRTRRELVAIAHWLDAAGIPLVLVQYPSEVGAYGVANRAIRSAAAETGARLVDSPAALARVPAAEQRWEQGLHPGARIYAEIAAEVERALPAL